MSASDFVRQIDTLDVVTDRVVANLRENGHDLDSDDRTLVWNTLSQAGVGTLSLPPNIAAIDVLEHRLRYLVLPECPNESPITPPAKDGDVGYDLKVWIEGGKRIIGPGEFDNIRTGVRLKLPRGFWGDIRPRSSTFAKRQLFVMGGTIDEGYTGEISIFLFNPTQRPHEVFNGDRLAQLVIAPRVFVPMYAVPELPITARAQSGFGSTGLNGPAKETL